MADKLNHFVFTPLELAVIETVVKPELKMSATARTLLGEKSLGELKAMLPAIVRKLPVQTPLVGLTSNSIQRVALNTTSVIAGAEYDNLPLKELKHKAARFDAIRYREVDTQAAQEGAGKQENNIQVGSDIGFQDSDDEVIMDNLKRGIPAKDTAKSLGIEEKTLYNREAILRQAKGDDKVPFRQDWRKRKSKKGKQKLGYAGN